MKTSSQAKWFNCVSIFSAVILLSLIPLCYVFRNPGGVSDAWYICAYGTLGLAVFNIIALKALWRGKVCHRLGIYLSLGVVIGMAFILLNSWQGQQQYNYWAHKSIDYLDPF